jgi:transposase
VIEASTHSPWIAQELAVLGHEPIVANPSAMFGAGRRRRRNDPLDAEFLARQGRADLRLLYPIQHRGALTQQHLTILRARDQLVRTRTQLITHVRCAVKTAGARLRNCTAESFVRRAGPDVPPEFQPSLDPVLEIITQLNAQIRVADRQIDQLIRDDYPVATRLQQPSGVGRLTALAFVLLIEDPRRFARSRDVGAYFGLVPRLDESGMSRPQLRITKSGDELGRRLLVSAAQYILGPFGPDCDLRRHGEAIAQRGGKNAKKRAVVAVARKLAVLLHHLWITEQPYDPDYLLKQRAQ